MTIIKFSIFFVLCASSALANTCENLSSLQQPHTKNLIAKIIKTGEAVRALQNKSGLGELDDEAKKWLNEMPSFCRVVATSKPTADSEIKFEIWLPTSEWNGNFRGVGNTYWGGSIPYMGMATALREGFATAGTDTGHEGTSVGFAFNHPEKLVDFAERSFHEMTLTAKNAVKTFYGRAPQLNFLVTCGGGSRQALVEAQRFPEDYDAILASGLLPQTTRHVFGQMWVWQAAHESEASYIPPEKYPAIYQAAAANCNRKLGAKHTVVLDPENCRFDPEILRCKGADGPNCLTAAQVKTARKIYQPPENPRTKEVLFGGLMPGSELGWDTLAGPKPIVWAEEYFKYFVFKDPTWDYKKRPVNFDADVALAESKENLAVNANDPDLSKFVSRGGKFLMAGGWSDSAIAPAGNTSYYKAVLAKMGTKVRDSVRLFMVPGMRHCLNQSGTQIFFDKLKAWKSEGKAPDQIVLPIKVIPTEKENLILACAYPKTIHYKGKGTGVDPSNFICK
jgi:feruloyl esterase